LGSPFIESAVEIQKQLDEATAKLAAYEDEVPSEQALDRLRASAPTHPVFIGRLFFGLAAAVSMALTITAFAFPFVVPMLDVATQRDLPIAEFFALERALALPLPVALGATSLFLTVGFFMARLAAVSMGREAPMLDWEAREHAELVAEVKQLTRQRNALRRAEPTPAAMGPRVTAPPVDPNASFVSFDGGGKGAAQWEEQPTSPHYAIAQSAPAAAESFLESGSSSFEVRRSTVFPTWGPCEPWLQSTIQKVQDLANTFPVQARIEFDQDRGMPFTLRLERATPAMTLRATIAFVEFLASIPAPPLARIDVAPIQVDRIFYRNVMSALEPHFPDTCSLDREDSAVILKFTAPDARWARYPKLPTA